MFTRRSWMGILFGVNVLLLTALIAQVVSLPAAVAQGGQRRGDYVCVTAKGSGQTFDVLFVLDVPDHKLHALYPPGGPGGKLAVAPPRDLKKDFDRN